MDEEKRLNDYKGFQIWKITDNKKMRNEKITYMAYENDNFFNAKNTLSELKKSINSYIK